MKTNEALINAQIGSIMTEWIDENGLSHIQEIPSYVCGHCNNVIALNPDRRRERRLCLRCGSLICEKTELCREICTPIHALAKDHFEDVRWGRYAAPILSGAETIAQAEAMLINGASAKGE